jgi:hypothetical protein
LAVIVEVGTNARQVTDSCKLTEMPVRFVGALDEETLGGLAHDGGRTNDVGDPDHRLETQASLPYGCALLSPT